MSVPGKTIYKAIAKLGFELIVIIVGILIALFVNNIQEEKHDRELLFSTLSSLQKEFSKNIENMASIKDRMERFRDTLTFYESNTKLSLNDLALKAKGLTTAELYTTNWQATISGNSLRLLHFETVTQLSRIDAKHTELKDQGKILESILYSPALYQNGQEGMVTRKLILEWWGGYMNNQKELMNLYTEFDEMITREKAR